MKRIYNRAAVAGTFDAIHSGHADLFDKAFSSAEKVLIGITADIFAKKLKERKTKPFAARLQAVRAFLGRERLGRAEIFKLNDPYGPAVSGKAGIDALVVSTETLPRAEEINRVRKKKGLAPLGLVAIPLIYAEDLKKIAARRVSARKTSKTGRLLQPVIIAVGTTNPTKLGGVRSVCERLFPKFRLITVKADSKVPAQPFAAETINGAVNRAIGAQRRAGADYGVGLESGLFGFYGREFDFQWCAVFDGENITLGCSMGFEVPSKIVSLVKKRKIDMSRAFQELTGIKNIGVEKGAINFLSRGVTERMRMSEQAFLCAMIPRLNRLGYGKSRMPKPERLINE